MSCVALILWVEIQNNESILEVINEGCMGNCSLKTCMGCAYAHRTPLVYKFYVCKRIVS